ncbi:SAVED domain-containing protein [Carnobacterium maltaromaticum]|uniref:SAVED domain-containing protein n=1 Tax=Carnobacterium maltaromaticum TaxID=2751 RepID=UPI0039BE2D5C
MTGNKKVGRHIPSIVQNALWSIAAGRCEMCGKKLYVEEKTNVLINISQKAHIKAFSENGSRFSKEQINPHELENLMLLCLEDHKIIDDFPKTYTVELLQKRKQDFEDKVSSIIDTQRIKSAILDFKSGNTKHDNTKDDKYELTPVLLNNNNFFDGNYLFIEFEVPGVEQNSGYYHFASQSIKGQIEAKKYILKQANCVSVFGLAPQPLLMYLGFLLNDETNIKVYQRSREGELKWDWKAQEITNTFSTEEINIKKRDEEADVDEVNVIVSISAEISSERVFEIQAKDVYVPTFVIKAKRQAHDAVQSEADADEFIKVFRNQILEKIRKDFPKISHINIFPAAPVSLPIRMGMNYQKNVDVEWKVFDNKGGKGFIYTLSIKGDGSVG